MLTQSVAVDLDGRHAFEAHCTQSCFLVLQNALLCIRCAMVESLYSPAAEYSNDLLAARPQPFRCNPLIAKVAFTGSVATGRRVALAAAEMVRPCSLELGGKSALLVFDDADIEKAVEWTMVCVGMPGKYPCFKKRPCFEKRHFLSIDFDTLRQNTFVQQFGVFWTSGQICSSTSRLLLHEGIADRFLALLKQRAESIKVRLRLRWSTRWATRCGLCVHTDQPSSGGGLPHGASRGCQPVQEDLGLHRER